MTKIIHDILEREDNLPCNFHIAIQVSKMLDDFNVSIDKLAKVIGTDQALSVKLLKYCNSAEYGFSRKISTVNDAIARLGFKSFKTIVFTIVSKSSLNREIRGYGLKSGEIWKNSISCAFYSRYLAELTDYVDPDQAFTAGMLRDIGKLALQEYVENDFKNIINAVNNEKIPFFKAEEKTLGVSHCHIGALLAERWSFPQVLVDAVKYHHCPEEAQRAGCEDTDLVNIVHLADYLALILGYGIGTDGIMYELDMTSVEGLGFNLTCENMELLIADIANNSNEIESLISNIE